ncbi:glycosyltransferase family 2 protein [Aliivibrio fischeri]|uniref:glycosyltransferase family 2 protein n=1 Tax=Aliivibrio fischeri TaxID=668 RepID=UPI00107E7313|nr:glycosyltransferase family 2 protein [Aliivibrio fischeri]TGA73341.1 glycosyltransferase family 2 protein [Aliivibrio fischeri]
MNISALIVAYNSDIELLKNNISNLLEQVSSVVICNNGENDLQVLSSEKVVVFDFEDNLGIAKAQSIGMKFSFDNGADFVVQLDDDSIIKKNFITDLIYRFNKLKSNGIPVGLIAPKHFDKIDGDVDEKRLPQGLYLQEFKVTEVHAVISSCSIIPRTTYESVGGMDDDLFIDYVDWEYCWRVQHNGLKVFRVEDLLLPHRVGAGVVSIAGNLDARIPSPIRHYYHSRNTIVLSFRNYSPKAIMLKEILKLPVKVLCYPFIFSDGFIRTKYILRGIWDGLCQRKGKLRLRD